MFKALHVLYAPDEPPQGGVTTEPVVTEPVVTEPVATEPVEPVTTEPVEPTTVPVTAVTAERKRRQAAETALATAREEAAFLRGQMATATPAEPVAPVAPAGPPAAPRSEDFDNWDAFQAADRQHLLDLAEFNVMRKIEQRDHAQVQQRTQQEAEGNWQKQRTAATVKYPDFQEVIGNPAFTQSPTVAEVIKSSEQGADVAYFLGTNLTEANRINALPPIQAAMAIGQIVARLATRPAAQPARVVSMAPEPVSTVTGSVSVNGGFDPETATMEEYRAHRQSELRGQRH